MVTIQLWGIIKKVFKDTKASFTVFLFITNVLSCPVYMKKSWLAGRRVLIIHNATYVLNESKDTFFLWILFVSSVSLVPDYCKIPQSFIHMLLQCAFFNQEKG